MENLPECFRVLIMDDLHYRVIFDLAKWPDEKKRNSRKEPFKSSKIPKFWRNVAKYGKYI